MDRRSETTLLENGDSRLGASREAVGLTRRERREGGRKAAAERRGSSAESTERRTDESADPVVVETLEEDLWSRPPGGVSTPRVLTRRKRRHRAQRRRRILVVVPTLAVLVFATFVIGRAVRRADSDSAGPAVNSPPSGAAAPALTSTTLLLEHRTADGRSDLLVVVGADQTPNQTGAGSSVLLLPPATLAEVPSLGLQALAEVTVLAEPALLPTTIENLLGVGLDVTVSMDDAELVAALEPAAPITVTVPSEVQALGPNGEVIIPAGEQSLSAVDAASVLTATGDVGQLDDLITVQSVLTGWLTRLADPVVGQATLAVAPELATLVDAAGTTTRIATLPVDSLATPAGEQFQVRSDDLDTYVLAAFPQALLGEDGERPRVEVLNGTGAVGSAQRVSSIVIPAGGKVTLTGNVPGFGVDETQVVYYRDSDRAAAELLLDAIDCGRLARAGKPIDIVDITVIIGADCPEF